MSTLDIILALFTLLCWGGVLVWYFHRDLRLFWISRNDKWFRQD